MRYASAIIDGTSRAVAIQDGWATPIAGVSALGAQTPSPLLADPPLEQHARVPSAGLTLRAVVPEPAKVFCVGLNYAAHAEETQLQGGDYPVLFTKFARSLTGPYADIVCPPESGELDYEGELVVVIGERARRISPERALDCVAGLSVANDVSMRDFQFRTSQWVQGKAWDDSTPVGPELVPLSEIDDIDALTLRTTVNGKTVQEVTTDRMIFSIATVISEISLFCELEPGDLILTGTPEGVGYTRTPPLRLVPGDVVAVEVDGVGRLENRFIAAEAT